MLNKHFGNHQTIRLIKSGGMADVFQGVDKTTGNLVAIKILKSDFQNDVDVVKRFYKEGAVLEKLDHPNIVKFLFNTEMNGHPVMVMEYLEGHDMNDFLNKDTIIDYKLFHQYFLQVFDAVIYAHSQNLIHRDIKPSNIFVTKEGIVKLLDFGIVKIMTDTINSNTTTGYGFLTPSYMSPEQAKGSRVITKATDIYSLGVTMYSILNGKNPYQNMMAFEIGHHVIHKPLPKLKGFTKLNKVIAKATAKEPDDRYKSVLDFKTAFEIAFETDDEQSKISTFISHFKKVLNVKSFIIGVIITYCLLLWGNCNKENEIPRDPDDNDTLSKIECGSQVWMKYNLNVTNFRNGDPIPQAQTELEWINANQSKQPAWCYFNMDPSNELKYGKLYNWFAVNDVRGLAPNGFHIPNKEEWYNLNQYLVIDAGYKMKATSGWQINTNGSNSSGFSGYPGGYRYNNGEFHSVGTNGYWWSATEIDSVFSFGCGLNYLDKGLNNNNFFKGGGLSVRCIKDNNDSLRFKFLDKNNPYYIQDLKLNTNWYIYKGGSIEFDEALKKQVNGYKIPTYDEIFKLHDKNKVAGLGTIKNGILYASHMDPAFSVVGVGHWYWVSDLHSDKDTAYAINMYTGHKVSIKKVNSGFNVYLILIKNN